MRNCSNNLHSMSVLSNEYLSASSVANSGQMQGGFFAVEGSIWSSGSCLCSGTILLL